MDDSSAQLSSLGPPGGLTPFRERFSLVGALLCTTLVGCYDSVPRSEGGDGSSGGLASDDSSGGGSGEDPPGDAACAGEDVAFVPMHRLSRAQYRNTVEDLFGLGLAVDLPADPIVDGFDNNANALGTTPALTEGFYDASTEIAAAVVATASARESIVTCSESTPACYGEVVTPLLRKVWRRPASEDEVTRYTDLFALGDTFDDGLERVVSAALLSPNFVFRVEIDPEPDSTEIRRLNGHELASRMSYLLWNTTPDTELSDAADRGALMATGELEDQLQRMLASPKAAALVDSFAAQWLGFADLNASNIPDPAAFPEYDAELAASMVEETRLWMSDYLLADEQLSTLLTRDETYVDARLAALYGVESPGPDFELVPVDARRAGLLTQASVLLQTSSADRTSPVKRGFWVLSRLLCSEPLPPPAGVETDFSEDDSGASSVREQLEQHRADPACAGCHVVMDELGFGMESYDVIGRFREEDAFGPVDDSGLIPTEQGDVSFTGVQEMSAVLAEDPRLPACVAEHSYVYALQRSLGGVDGDVPGDECRLQRVVDDFEASDGQYSALLRAIVTSDAFVSRRGAQP